MSTASAAAALVVALTVGGWTLSQVGSSDDTRDNSSAFKAGAGSQAESAIGDAASPVAADAADAAGGGSADLSTLAAAPGYDAGAIGAYNDVDSVAAKAKADMGQPADVSAEHAYTGPSPCGDDDNASVKWHASLTYDGLAAWARVVDFGDPKWLLQVLRQTDCVLLATQTIEPTTPR